MLWEQASGHPNVLPIIEADDYDGQVVIVSEYAPDGSLEDLLKKNNGSLPLKQAVEMTIGILAGLDFLHLAKYYSPRPETGEHSFARRYAATCRLWNFAGDENDFGERQCCRNADLYVARSL